MFNKFKPFMFLLILLMPVYLVACKPNPKPELEVRKVKVLKTSSGGCVASIWSIFYTDEIIRRMSEKDIRGEVKPSQINTDLMAAAVRNQPEKVSSLLSGGADVEATNEKGCTALIWASALGHSEIVESLISAGADVSKPDGSGKTPIMFASSAGSEEIASLLLAAGASARSAQTGDSNETGRTALHLAVYRQNNIDVINLLVESDVNIDATSVHGQTALMNAAQSGKLQNVKRLVELGANVHLKSNRGSTALDYAKGVNPKVLNKDALVEYLESRN